MQSLLRLGHWPGLHSRRDRVESIILGNDGPGDREHPEESLYLSKDEIYLRIRTEMGIDRQLIHR